MAHPENKCILWVGDKHSGKTTAAAKLVECLREAKFTVGGVLSPSVYENGRLTGFDIIDILNDVRIPLSVRDEHMKGCVPFRYHQEGFRVGHCALSSVNNKSANLIIVDEYGPLELSGEGWRVDVDDLLVTSCPPILLVVRRSLVDEVMRLYGRWVCLSLEALEPDSINKMLVFILNQYSKRDEMKGKP